MLAGEPVTAGRESTLRKRVWDGITFLLWMGLVAAFVVGGAWVMVGMPL